MVAAMDISSWKRSNIETNSNKQNMQFAFLKYLKPTAVPLLFPACIDVDNRENISNVLKIEL